MDDSFGEAFPHDVPEIPASEYATRPEGEPERSARDCATEARTATDRL